MESRGDNTLVGGREMPHTQVGERADYIRVLCFLVGFFLMSWLASKVIFVIVPDIRGVLSSEVSCHRRDSHEIKTVCR